MAALALQPTHRVPRIPSTPGLDSADPNTKQWVVELLEACGVVQPRLAANAGDFADSLEALGYDTLPSLAGWAYS